MNLCYGRQINHQYKYVSIDIHRKVSTTMQDHDHSTPDIDMLKQSGTLCLVQGSNSLVCHSNAKHSVT